MGLLEVARVPASKLALWLEMPGSVKDTEQVTPGTS
jgi:hypothetical protein